MSESAPGQDDLRPPRFAKLAELAAAHAVPGEPQVEMEAWMVHAEFEAQTDAEGNTRYRDPSDCDGVLRIADRAGAVWTLECDKCAWEVGANLMRSDPERMIAWRLDRSSIPPAFLGKEFDRAESAQQESLGVCRHWVKHFRSEGGLPAVALWGQAGRGKTHLLCLMVETLIRLYGTDAVYRSAAEMFDELQAGFDTGSYEAAWKRLLNVGVLALDDLGAGARSEWRNDRLMALVDHRYAKELPLLIATNIPPARWPDVFGERTASRLKGLCLPVRIEGPDRRAQGVQQELAA